MNTTIANYSILLVAFHWILFAESSVLGHNAKELVRTIVGGYLAKPQQFPYAVSVQERNDKRLEEYLHVCTFSLITTLSVLGAAHCMMGPNGKIGAVEDYLGILGTVDHKNTTNVVSFDEFRIHADFEEEIAVNDIAILVFSETVNLGNFIKTIPLIGAGLSFIGKRATTLGWGKTHAEDRKPSRMLRYVDVNIVSNDFCEYYYGFLDRGQFCYGTEGKGSCDGDSGGPIVVKLQNMEVQIGITSYSKDPCASYPTVGVSVGYFNEWIRNNAEGNPVFVNLNIKFR